MKTMNSKLQKAAIELLSVLAIIFATSFTINAQGANFKSRFSNKGHLASIVTTKAPDKYAYDNDASANFKITAELLTKESESDLAIESWMTDESFFEVKEMETEIEQELKLEEWMSDEKLFRAEKEEKSQENQMIIMIDRKTKTIAVTFPGVQFGRRTFVLTEMEDEKMELEQWMVNKSVWLKKI